VKSLIHFLRLVRWPNLFFILLAESLFHFFIYKPLYPNLALTADYPFYFIVVTSICIAAAGYIINDYFDAKLWGDIFSYGTYRLNIAPTYRVRYRYNGGLTLSYQSLRNFIVSIFFALSRVLCANCFERISKQHNLER
jgi:hypothetical protein